MSSNQKTMADSPSQPSQEIKEVLLQFVEGENEGVELRIYPPRTLTIGRSEECDVYLGEKKISRKHCQLIVEPFGVKVKDLGSTNGIFVNEEKTELAEVSEQDRIQIGTTVIQLVFHKEIAHSLAQIEDVATGAKIDESKATIPRPSENSDAKGGADATSVDEAAGADSENLDSVEDDSAADAVPKASASSSPSFSEEIRIEKQTQNLVDEDAEAVNEIVEPMPTGNKGKVDTEMPLEPADQMSESEKSEAFFALADESSAPEPAPDISSFENQEASGTLDVEALGSASISEEREEAKKEEKPKQKKKKSKKKSEKLKVGNTILKGDLSAMALADLLQNLSQNKKSGILRLKNEQQSGEVMMVDGELFQAHQNEHSNEKALYRMLGWTSGEFGLHEMSDTKETPEREMHQSLNTLLMNGYRQQDEAQAYLEQLPPLDSKLELIPSFQAPLSKLHPRVLDILQLAIHENPIQGILDKSELTDLETIKVLLYLIKKDYLQKSK